MTSRLEASPKTLAQRLVVASMLLAAASGLVSCADEEVGDACSLPSEIAEQCASDDRAQSREICVFELSSDCSSQLCARYLGSEDFCTENCAPGSDSCGGDAVCVVAPGSAAGFCVPRATYDSAAR
jgi:hypothetical protein